MKTESIGISLDVGCKIEVACSRALHRFGSEDLSLTLPAIFFDIGNTLVSRREWLAGAHDNLRTLASVGIALGIISNTGTLTREQLKRDHLPRDFDFGLFNHSQIILSSEFGSDKSTPEIFLHAIGQSQRLAFDCIFVGESLLETWTAQSAGMRSAWISKFPDDLDDFTKQVSVSAEIV